MTQRDYDKNFGIFNEGLIKDKWTSKYLVAFGLLRKLIFALTLVSDANSQGIKLLGNIFMEYLYILFLIRGRPYESRFKNNLEIFNEICIYLVMFTFVPFTD